MAEFFRRVEKKYIISKQQYLALKKILNKYMVEDEHGKSTICNLYFDTDNYDLIMHSITKPVFKEKVRLRSYNVPNLDSNVYLEVKRKYDGVVSKRRVEMKLKEYYNPQKRELNLDNQVEKELKYYFDFYHLSPKMFLSYSRRAYYDKNNRDFRVTFDSNIIARPYDFEIEKGVYGEYILDPNKYIMEIKTLGAIPFWFVKILTDLNVYPCGFSKYGEAYTQLVLKANKLEEYVV